MEDFRPKKSKVPVLPWRAKQRKHKTPKAQTECGSCNQEEKIEEKLKKAIKLKWLELCKTRSEKSSPDLFKFYVVLAGHYKITNAGGDTTCRRKFKALSLQTKARKMKELPEMSSTEKLSEGFRRKKITFLA